MKQFSKKQIIWTVGIVGLILSIIFIRGGSGSKATLVTTTVKYGDVIQEVSVTGRVKPITEVKLGFEKSGRIQGVYVDVGSRIEKGGLIAEVESSGAQASLMEIEARLAELKRGSRPEEINVKKAELAKYEQDLANAYGGVLDTINDAFNKSDDALHVKMTGVFSGFKTSSYKFTYQICDSQLDVNGAWLRYTTETDFDAWRAEQVALPATPTDAELDLALDAATKHTETLRAFLESVNRTLTLDCTIANTGLDTYRTNVNLARANAGAALSALNAKKQSIASLALTVATVKNQLSLLDAGTAVEVIRAQEARVLGAQGDLRKYRVYAPIAGTITRADAKTGEFSNITTTPFSLSSDALFEMEANVPEADIAKIKIGNNAHVTLDAYGSDMLFEGRVVAIDPAETIVDNVPTYKVTLDFLKNDPRIKSGMTANIDVATAKQVNVLLVPQRSTQIINGKRFVTVVNADQTTQDVEITTGLRGSDGLIEVVAGLTEGAKILSTPKEK